MRVNLQETKLPCKKLTTKTSHKSAPATKGAQKHHRCRPGALTLREIRHDQKSTDLLIRKLPFQSLAREIVQDFNADLRFQGSAILRIQEEAVACLSGLFKDANLRTTHAARVAIMLNDTQLECHIRGNFS